MNFFTEPDTALGGTPRSGFFVTGHQALETQTALTGAAQSTVHGLTASELDTAFTGIVTRNWPGVTAGELNAVMAGAPADLQAALAGDDTVSLTVTGHAAPSGVSGDIRSIRLTGRARGG